MKRLQLTGNLKPIMAKFASKIELLNHHKSLTVFRQTPMKELEQNHHDFLKLAPDFDQLL